MASIDRTAYPQLGKQLSDDELYFRYSLDDDELDFIRRQSRNDRGHLVLATLLKSRQQLGYFIGLEKIPQQIISYLAEQLEVAGDAWHIDDVNFNRSLYRYHAACRERLGCAAFSEDGNRCHRATWPVSLLYSMDKAEMTRHNVYHIMNY